MIIFDIILFFIKKNTKLLALNQITSNILLTSYYIYFHKNNCEPIN